MSILSKAPPVRNPRTFLLLTCLAFAIAAGVTRSILTHVHSRLQIAGFFVLALLFQFVVNRRLDGVRSRATRFAFIWNALAAAIAIIVVRTGLEGVDKRLLSVFRSL